MINVIICDDNKRDLKKICNIVDMYMEKNNNNYSKHIFYDYDEEFMSILNKKLSFKIYILDIETPSRSGIDIAREIRIKDSDSSIIFLTGHNDLGLDLLKEDIPFTAFINKYVNSEKRLINCLTKSLSLMHKRRMLKIQEGGIIYTIDMNDILYITKDSIERKTIIITDYSEFKLSKTLSAIKEMLGYSFVQSHRSCIINRDRVCKIDFNSKIIAFDNNLTIDLLSNKYRKGVVE